jgi:hypothetical protein
VLLRKLRIPAFEFYRSKVYLSAMLRFRLNFKATPVIFVTLFYVAVCVAAGTQFVVSELNVAFVFIYVGLHVPQSMPAWVGQITIFNR